MDQAIHNHLYFLNDYSHQKTDWVDIDIQLTFDLLEALAIERAFLVNACAEDHDWDVFKFFDFICDDFVVGKIGRIKAGFDGLNFNWSVTCF